MVDIIGNRGFETEGRPDARVLKLEERFNRFLELYRKEWLEAPGWANRIDQTERTLAVLLKVLEKRAKKPEAWQEEFQSAWNELFPPPPKPSEEFEQRLKAMETMLQDVLQFLGANSPAASPGPPADDQNDEPEAAPPQAGPVKFVSRSPSDGTETADRPEHPKKEKENKKA